MAHSGAMAPKARAGRAKAKAAAESSELPEAVPDNFNSQHFAKILNMKREILQHEVFAGIEGMLPLNISGTEGQASGREVLGHP